MILSQKHDILYKERMSHKHKMQVTAQKSLNYNFRKPFLERETKEVSFKGGFSLATLKKAFSPYVKKTYKLTENLNILENQGTQLNFFDFPVVSTSPAISKVDDLHSSILGQL